MKAKKYNFIGHVQGVGFRWTALQCSEGISIVGYVKNLPDGSVELWAQGSEKDIATFINKLSTRMAGKISQVSAQEQSLDTFDSFQIER